MRLIKLTCLMLVLTFSLGACAPGTAETQTQTEEAPVTQKVESKTEEEKVKYDKVDTPLTPERVAAIPIADSTMTSDQLRQICIDYVKLSVSFQWVPNMDFSYKANQSDDPVRFYEGKLHGGIPYINTASGNLYRMLEFYDVKTGILDVQYLSRNTKIFGTACSGTTGWGWNRVINSARCAWTQNLNAGNGLIPVGPYTYDLTITDYQIEGAEDCKDIAYRNGEQTMYESYAQSLAADCYVNNGHVRMNSEAPIVVRNEDNTINGEESYVMQVEQGLFVNHSNHDRVSADGTPYKVQGNEGYKRTFAELYKDGYLPHTFAEFLGTDPIEPATATIGIADGAATLAQLEEQTLSANYVISDIFISLFDQNGNKLFSYTTRMSNHFTREYALSGARPATYLRGKDDGAHTVSISAQLGNGQIVTAFTGTLVK